MKRQIAKTKRQFAAKPAITKIPRHPRAKAVRKHEPVTASMTNYLAEEHPEF